MCEEDLFLVIEDSGEFFDQLAECYEEGAIPPRDEWYRRQLSLVADEICSACEALGCPKSLLARRRRAKGNRSLARLILDCYSAIQELAHGSSGDLCGAYRSLREAMYDVQDVIDECVGELE